VGKFGSLPANRWGAETQKKKGLLALRGPERGAPNKAPWVRGENSHSVLQDQKKRKANCGHERKRIVEAAGLFT